MDNLYQTIYSRVPNKGGVGISGVVGKIFKIIKRGGWNKRGGWKKCKM